MIEIIESYRKLEIGQVIDVSEEPGDIYLISSGSNFRHGRFLVLAEATKEEWLELKRKHQIEFEVGEYYYKVSMD